MDPIDKPAELLERPDPGEEPAKLMEAGIAPEGLRHLCSAHMEMLADELERMKAKLKPGHVIHTMVREHEMILGFLDKLEKVNQTIQKMENYSRENEVFKRLANIAEHLIGTEPHHQREENVIFSEIEKEGIFGPTQVMKMEHNELRIYEKELKELTENVEKMDFDTFKKRLNTAAKFIILTLRDHIFKENNLLYPTALQVIMTWDKIKSDCDEIGYCCFTPEV